MDSGKFKHVPRVSLKDLRSKSCPTEIWEMASEKLTLAMCRYNVCVLKIPIEATDGVSSLFGRLTDLLSPLPGVTGAMPHLATSEEEPGLLVRPGWHSYSFKLGSSRSQDLLIPDVKRLESVSCWLTSTKACHADMLPMCTAFTECLLMFPCRHMIA